MITLSDETNKVIKWLFYTDKILRTCFKILYLRKGGREGEEESVREYISMSYLSPTFSSDASCIPIAVETSLISESELLATNTIGNFDLQVMKILSVYTKQYSSE